MRDVCVTYIYIYLIRRIFETFQTLSAMEDESSDYSASPEPLELPEPTEPAAKRCRRLIPFSLEDKLWQAELNSQKRICLQFRVQVCPGICQMCQNSFSIIWFLGAEQSCFFPSGRSWRRRLLTWKLIHPITCLRKQQRQLSLCRFCSNVFLHIVDMILGGISRWLNQGSVLNFLAAPSFTNFLECNKGHAKTLSQSVTVSKDSTDSIRIVSTYFIVWSLKPYQKSTSRINPKQVSELAEVKDIGELQKPGSTSSPFTIARLH